MADSRDYDVLSRNLCLIEERKRDLVKMLRWQYREVMTVYGASSEEEREIPFGMSPAEEVGGLFRRMYPDLPLGSTEFAFFCGEYSSFFKDKISLKSLLQPEETDPAEENGRTLYMKNAYGDLAYRKFSSRFDGMKAVYSSGYASACEDVFYGGSTYVILPIYSSRDGTLITFRQMIRKYDLKISAVCPIEMETGESVLYALVQKGFPEEKGEYLDLSVVIPDGGSAAQFFGLCEAFGLQMRLVGSIPQDYTTDLLGKNEINISFYSKEADISAFLLFLNASHTRYSIEGIYSVLQ